MSEAIQFKVNGAPVTVAAGENRTLLWALRGDLGLTGTKYGCGEGICGACAVLVDGKAHRACRMSLSDVAGKAVLTVEGLAHDGRLHPLQQAFIDHGAFQCGYCTSGMLMDALALLNDIPHPTREQIVARMDHNLCRCGAHQRIVAAIEAASAVMGAPA
jgi:aerobic-type carbon monoxide dehydrogenase small subunit (CoxS/CutS family)